MTDEQQAGLPIEPGQRDKPGAPGMRDRVRTIETGQLTLTPLWSSDGRSAQAQQNLQAHLERYGLLQLSGVRTVGQGYELIWGSRRVEALRALGATKLQVLLVEADDVDALLLSGSENLQRQGLTAPEKARLCATLIELGVPRARIAAELGIGEPAISRLLSVANEPLLAAALRERRITWGEAYELRRVPPKRLAEILDRLHERRAAGTPMSIDRELRPLVRAVAPLKRPRARPMDIGALRATVDDYVARSGDTPPDADTLAGLEDLAATIMAIISRGRSGGTAAPPQADAPPGIDVSHETDTPPEHAP